jgi:hypothetical protein
MVSLMPRPFLPAGKRPASIQFKDGCAPELDWNNAEEINFLYLRVKETKFLSCPAFILVITVTMLSRVLLVLILSTAFSISVVSLVHHIFVA